jgi:nucleoside diphosphate kinase
MPVQLAYVIITPYSLLKSRTGGIIARLIARSGLELVGARMFAPSLELAQQYAALIGLGCRPDDDRIQELIRQYVRQHLAPDPRTQRRRRVMVLLFKGEEATDRLRAVIGNVSAHQTRGDTIRGTYGDLITDENDVVHYFEPAVLYPPTPEDAEKKLRLWARYSDTDGGVLENVITYAPGEAPERTLVLLKPDNFRFASGRPGNMIDFFSRTGLFIVAITVHRMSTAEAVEFYSPVRELLRTKFKEAVAARAMAVLEKELGFRIPEAQERQLGELLGPLFGENQFESIVRFMSGHSPAECEPQARSHPGSQKSIALVYEGANAVSKIRDVLGPTDPTQAPPGSIRREFGSNIMVNAAHASDSVDSARREMAIINVADNNFRRTIEEFYGP